ncbi:hypothetical protein Fcan01_26584 [Folsomia candida]|uniref:Glycosyltransferase family 92 protein n=1 Tax=Folsomia candida TaxID=158441 RepID=A0A226D1X1_FOLCA|nr:hypothetical protein Fcan01_26584 [Folsomia candida]
MATLRRIFVGTSLLVFFVFFAIIFSGQKGQIEFNFIPRKVHELRQSVMFWKQSVNQGEEENESGEEDGKSGSALENLRAELESIQNFYVDDEILGGEASGVFDFNNVASMAAGPKTKACSRAPHLHEILFSNTYWQMLRVIEKNTTGMMYLYSANADGRGTGKKIRVVTMIDDAFRKANFTATFKNIWPWGQSGAYHPILVTCHLDDIDEFDAEVDNSDGFEWPASVSIVYQKCQQATNQLKVVNKDERVGDFGVCFKWLDFSEVDLSRRIIEMVELLRVLGVSGIHFPYMAAHPNVDKVLKYYEDEDHPIVHLKPFSLPGPYSNLPHLRHLLLRRNNNVKLRSELIPYVACFLENMYRYKYIAIIDIDEVVLPTANSTFTNYPELFEELEKMNTNVTHYSFCFDMKLFLDRMQRTNGTLVADLHEIRPELFNDPDPQLPYVMNKVYFDKAYLCNSGRHTNVKCFHNTESVLLVHNHSPSACLEGVTSCSKRGLNLQKLCKNWAAAAELFGNGRIKILSTTKSDQGDPERCHLPQKE